MSILSAHPEPARTDRLVLCGSKDPDAKVTVLMLDGAHTVGAAKVATTAGARQAVIREVAVLRYLPGLLPESLMATIPTVVGTTTEFGAAAPVLSALPGLPMSVEYHSRGHLRTPAAVDADFAAVEDWLSRLQNTSTGPERPVVDVDALNRRLQVRFDGEQVLTEALPALERMDRDLGDHRSPSVVVHGDLWFGNVLVDRPGGRVTGVVDWEEGQVAGSPMADLARFPITYALYLDRHTRPNARVRGHRGLRRGLWGGGVTYAVNGNSWFSRRFRRSLVDGLGRLGLPGSAWRSAVLFGLADAAATANHHGFAHRHLRLLADLAEDRR